MAHLSVIPTSQQVCPYVSQLKHLSVIAEKDVKAHLQAPSQGFLVFLFCCFDNALTQSYCYL